MAATPNQQRLLSLTISTAVLAIACMQNNDAISIQSAAASYYAFDLSQDEIRKRCTQSRSW